MSQKKAARHRQDWGRRVCAGEGPASSSSTYTSEGCKHTHNMQGEPPGVNSTEEKKKIRCFAFVAQLLLGIWWIKNCSNLVGGKNDHTTRSHCYRRSLSPGTGHSHSTCQVLRCVPGSWCLQQAVWMDRNKEHQVTHEKLWDFLVQDNLHNSFNCWRRLLVLVPLQWQLHDLTSAAQTHLCSHEWLRRTG